MKKIMFTTALVSALLVSNVYADEQCVQTSSTFSSVHLDAESTPENFDPNIPVDIVYEQTQCGWAVQSGQLPYAPQIGDTRTITQTRDGWVYETHQTFTVDGWFTTYSSQRYIGKLPADL